MVARSDESTRDQDLRHRNSTSSGTTTGALNILKEKCILPSWRSTKDESCKNNRKEQRLANGHSHSPSSQPILLSDSKQSSSCDKNMKTSEKSAEFLYDLYAVCNHHGTDLQGGHYTATCRNPTDGKWYAFDDVHTRSITKPEDEVVSEDAYILFYQKCSSLSSNMDVIDSRSPLTSRKLKTLETKKDPITQTNGVLPGSLGESHWVYRMPDFNYKGKTTSSKTAQGSAVVSKQQSGENGKTKNSTPTTTSENKSSEADEKENSAGAIKNHTSVEESSSQEVQPITSGTPSENSNNFQRKSKGKYATLPAMPKRCLEDDSSTKCDTNSSKCIRSSNQVFSSQENNSPNEDSNAVSQGEGDTKSLSCKKSVASPKSTLKVLQNGAKLDRRTDSDLELDTDIQRPLDKNDVD